MSKKAVDIVCFARDSSGGSMPRRKRYIVSAEEAQEKVREIVEKLLDGEIDSFAVCLLG